MVKHIPVLVKEVCSFLSNAHFIADLTLGLGGHSRFFLEQNHNIFLYAVDKDEQAILYSKQNLQFAKQRVQFFHNDFYSQSLSWQKEKRKFDFIFADLGVCSMQLDDEKRGFSFSKETKLDMRMDVRQNLTAYEVINFYTQEKLQEIFFTYAQEPRSKTLAKKIIQRRQQKLFETGAELGSFIASHNSYTSTSKKHPATKIFQAIRIEVNKELELLKKMLESILFILKPAGKFAIISFHSLEDRIVKKKFNQWQNPPSTTPFPLPKIFPNPVVKILTKKPIIPIPEEIKHNPRSRSAKLRVCEKLA